MANQFFLTSFVSKTLGTMLGANCPMMTTSYRGVREFDDNQQMGYGTQDVVDIKIPGYPSVQKGLSVTSEDIIDKIVAYTTSDDDVYNVTRSIDVRRERLQIVGQRLALAGDPNRNPDNAKEINPQARTLIDKYVYPAALSIASDIEQTLAEKARKAAFYTPIDTPSKLGSINSYNDVAQVTALMDDLGFMKSATNRLGVMNIQDARQVTSSVQNMFNQTINENITKTARLGGPDKGEFAGQNIYTSNVLADTADSPQYTNAPTATVTVDSIAADGSTITFTGVISTTGVVFNAGTMIALPATKLLKKASKLAASTNLVIKVAQDANGDGAGNVTVTLSEPVVATGDQANVNVLPANSDAALIYPGHKNNYFYVPMGIIANPLRMTDIVGADNSHYMDKKTKAAVTCYIQGVVDNGVNTYRMSCLCPTLAIPDYLIHLPSALNS